MEDIDKEINAMKIAINSRGRTVASEFMKQFDSWFDNDELCRPAP